MIVKINTSVTQFPHTIYVIVPNDKNYKTHAKIKRKIKNKEEIEKRNTALKHVVFG